MKRIVLIVGGLAGLAVLAVVALVVITMLRDDDPELLTSAPEIVGTVASSSTAISQPTPSAGGPTPAAGAATQAPAAANVLRFVVDPGQSSATYVVREKLSRLPVENDASGTTTDTPEGDVTGELFLTTTGLAAGNKSSFRVDLNTIRSDERLRDNFVRSNTLQTGQANNRYATFSIDSVDGFPANYTEGTEVSLKLTGQMTIKGITRPLTFDVKARRQGDVLTAVADTTFNMSEFGISPPNVPTARAHDGVLLQVVLFTRRAVG